MDDHADELDVSEYFVSRMANKRIVSIKKMIKKKKQPQLLYVCNL